MKKFEYAVVPEGIINEPELDGMGVHGWELILVHRNDFYFKREMTEEDNNGTLEG